MHQAVLALQREAGNAATTALLRNTLPGLGGATSRPPPLPPVRGDPPPPARSDAWRAVSAQLAAVAGAARTPMVAASGGTGNLTASIASDAERLARSWKQLDGGRSLGREERAPYERSYGRDLSSARVHSEGGAAGEITSTLGVEALTVGNHMVFARSPAPDVLGHELAHVVQQSQGPRPVNDRLRAASPGSTVEADAEHAARAALAGQPYAVGPSGGEDMAMLAPLVWLAIAALVLGAGIGVAAETAGPSYEENRRRAEARHADDSAGSWAHAAWLWVPVGGTALRIWEAQSAAERVFNIVMMPIDVLTLGAVGASMGKIANRALWREALAAASEEQLRNLAGQGVRAVGAEAVNAQARAALEGGQAIIATVGRRNHALVFVKVAGKYYKLAGGAMRSMGVRELESLNIRNLNAFYAFGGEVESAAMLTEARQLSRFFGPGVGFSFRSCGISAARLAETGGLDLGLQGGRSYLPITVMGRLAAAEGGVVTSQVGASRMLSGTTSNYMLMGTMRGAGNVASNPRDFASTIVHRLASNASGPAPPAPAPQAQTPYGPGVEVSEAEVYAALDSGVGDDIDINAVPAAYRGLQAQVAPAEGGASGGATEIIPLFEFIGAPTDEMASRPPNNINACFGRSSAPGPAQGDPRRVLELSGHAQYRNGARSLAAALGTAPSRNAVLDRAHDYFAFSFPGPDERDTAIAAVERAGVTGADLDRASAALSAGGP